MKLPRDPHLLYSLINMKLRNDYADWCAVRTLPK